MRATIRVHSRTTGLLCAQMTDDWNAYAKLANKQLNVT